MIAATSSPFRTFERDARGTLSLARFRVTGAVVVSLGAIWMLIVRPSVSVALLAVLAFGIAAFWLRWARGTTRSRDPIALHLRPDALELAYDDVTRNVVVPWASIATIEVDEDRLVVAIQHGAEQKLELDPIGAGVGLYDFAAAIRAAHEAASRPNHQSS